MLTPLIRPALTALLLFSACALGPEEIASPATAQAGLSAARPTVRETVASLTAKGPETVERVAGSNMSVIRHGNAEVLIAKKNPDGTVTRRCVSSTLEADAFLGAAPKAAAQ